MPDQQVGAADAHSNQAEHALGGELREARQLWTLRYTEDDKWVCVDEKCRAQMIPCCWQRPNHKGEFCKESGEPYRMPPYFRAEPKHAPGCRVRLHVGAHDTAQPVFHLDPPADYPGRVILFRAVPKPPSGHVNERSDVQELDDPDRRRVRSTRGILEACEYYADHPEQHWRSLRVDRCSGDTYQRCFVRLGTGERNTVGRNWIFFDQIWLGDWIDLDAEPIALPLLSTAYREPRRLIISTADWVADEQSELRRRLRAGLKEARVALREQRAERAWVFFFGQEESHNQTQFHVHLEPGIAILVRPMRWHWDLRPGNGYRTKPRAIFTEARPDLPLFEIVDPVIDLPTRKSPLPGKDIQPKSPLLDNGEPAAETEDVKSSAAPVGEHRVLDDGIEPTAAVGSPVPEMNSDGAQSGAAHEDIADDAAGEVAAEAPLKELPIVHRAGQHTEIGSTFSETLKSATDELPPTPSSDRQVGNVRLGAVAPTDASGEVPPPVEFAATEPVDETSRRRNLSSPPPDLKPQETPAPVGRFHRFIAKFKSWRKP